jgi:DNA-binding CsgD family transcriptional regulator
VRERVDGVVIGRQPELATAGRFLDDAARRPCGLLLAGEPGIGKTTIWSSVLEEARVRGNALLVANPSEAEQQLAFAVLGDLLRTVADDVLARLPVERRVPLQQALRRGGHGGPVVDPVAVALAVLEVLRLCSAGGPVLVAIDDLQWADAPSLRALTFAYRRLEAEPVGLLVTVRTGTDDELLELAARGRSGLRRLDVGALGEQELAELVRERTGRVLSATQLGRLAELSGGSPYYALELAASREQDLVLPESLSVALRTRLSAVSGRARAAGLVVASLGRVEDGLLDDRERTGLAELREAGIVDVRSGALWFAHPLLASTLLELHTSEERQAVHLRLAAVLADPDERAVHLARGTTTAGEEVAAQLERAAHRLDARGAPETAAALAERSADLTPDPDTAARTRRLLLAADLYQAAGEGGAHVLPVLDELAETLPAGPDRAAVLVRLGWLGAQMDTISASEAVAFQQRALEEAGDTPEVGVAAHAVLARLLGNSGDYAAAHRHAVLAVTAGEQAEANPMFPSPSGELGTAMFLAGRGFDERLFERGIEAEASLERVGEPYQTSQLQLALALLYSGQLPRARAALDELLERSVELGRIRSTAGCLLHLIDLEVRAGRLERAEAHAAAFVHLDRQLRGERSGEWYPSGLVAVQLGRVEDARRILLGGIEYSRAIESTVWLAHQLWALGHLELAAGNLEPAREALVPLPALLRRTGLGEWSVHPVHPDAIETLVELGELDEAAALTDELEEYGRRLDRPWGIATAARSRALLASARGDGEEAVESIERALAAHERLEWPLERARSLLVAGSVLRRLGKRREAAARLGEARSVFAALRSPLWQARAEAEEGRLGGRRRASNALTPAEARVADLAGRGLRNAEIAARLHVTPKTVEATLSRVYRKLGVRSRTELARRLTHPEAETAG